MTKRTWTHKCLVQFEWKQPFSSHYGTAICNATFIEEEAYWGADNGEYRSPIAFCPWCGEKLPLPAVETETCKIQELRDE